MPDYVRENIFNYTIKGTLVYLAFCICKILLLFGDAIEFSWWTLAILNTAELLFWIRLFLKRYFPAKSIYGYIFFLFVNFAYVNVSVVMLALGDPVFPFDVNYIWDAMGMQSLMSTHLYLFIYLLHKPQLMMQFDIEFFNWKSKLVVNKTGFFISSIAAVLLALVYWYVFTSSGASALVGQASRNIVTKTAETGKLWLIQYIFIAWLISVILVTVQARWRIKVGWASAFMSVLAIMIFLYIYISLGNRRELVIGIIFLCSTFMMSGKMRLITSFAILTFPFLLFSSVLRSLEGARLATVDSFTIKMNLFGEFIFPHYPLLYYLNKGVDSFLFGSSYFQFPLYFLSSLGLYEKQYSFAQKFASAFSDGSSYIMGYAFTPLAEGFLNFGLLSPVLVAGGISLVLYLVLRKRIFFPVGWLVLIAFALDINRGEFNTLVIQWLIFCVTAVGFLALNRSSSIPSQR